MAINNVVCVQYSGGLLPDILLLTQCYYHRGIRLNVMKRFCICSPCVVTHTYSKRKDRPDKVASPAHGQLNRKNEYFAVRVRA